MSIEFFKALAGKVDHLAEEVTVYQDRIEENLYNFEEVPFHYKAALFSIIPTLDLTDLEQFSFQVADGVSYQFDKFMCVFRNADKVIGSYPELNHIKKPHGEWCVNYYVTDTPIAAQVKFFDMDVDQYELPALPEGSEFYPHVGIGQGIDGQLLGLYFGHTDVEMVSTFFNLPKPYVEELKDYIESSVKKVFGITFEKDTLKVVKLKLYYYPGQEDIDEVIYDETKHHQLG